MTRAPTTRRSRDGCQAGLGNHQVPVRHLLEGLARAQHERFAIMRAIETRRAIARAANTGISCFVTPYGSIIGETREGEATSTTATIELRDDMTLYTRWGDWWPILCLIVAGGMIGYAALGRSGRRAVVAPTGDASPEEMPAVADRS